MAQPQPQPGGPVADSQPDVPGQMGPRTGGDPLKAHEHAVEASKHLEALATEMGKMDAPDQAIQAVTQMADAVRGMAKSMAKAPAPVQNAAEAKAHTMSSATDELAADARRP